MLRALTRVGCVTAVVAAVSVVPQTAWASTILADGTVIMTGTPEQYTFTTTSYYWSIVGVNTAADYDLTLANAAGTPLSSSTYATGYTDFVAIDSNRRPLGSYRATVNRYAGTGPYWIQQRQGNFIVTLPFPKNDGVDGPADQDLAFSPPVVSSDVIRVADVWLNAGEAFWAKVTSTDTGFFFLESNPTQPDTFIRNRSQAATIPGTRAAQGCILYVAHYTGWHGLVTLTLGRPETTNPVSGNAYALHRYDPARPNTCPQRNFPAYTPPGP